MANRYGPGARRTISSAIRKRKRMKNRKQAIAIGISEARRKGQKVPRKRSASR